MEFKFSTLIELIRYFNTEEKCYNFLEAQIWPSGAFCPHCNSMHVYTRSSRSKNPIKTGVKEYKCAEKGCNKNFTATVGTIFQSSKLPLQTWFAAIFLAQTSSKGISSVQLSKQLGITQKTAWFVLSRIREALTDTDSTLLEGEVEVDETYIGGKERNKHTSKRRPKGTTGAKGMAPVLGMIVRGGKLVTKALEPDTANGLHIKPIVRQYVSKDAILYTDGFGAYKDLHLEYNEHNIISHDKDEYVRGRAHTNTIEGVWSIMKRGISGIYHFVSAKHLQRYCNEYASRYNQRNLSSGEKFAQAIISTRSTSITYDALVKKGATTA